MGVATPTNVMRACGRDTLNKNQRENDSSSALASRQPTLCLINTYYRPPTTPTLDPHMADTAKQWPTCVPLDDLPSLLSGRTTSPAKLIKVCSWTEIPSGQRDRVAAGGECRSSEKTRPSVLFKTCDALECGNYTERYPFRGTRR